MPAPFPHLAEPIRLGSRTARNRVMRLATVTNLGDAHGVGERMLAHYRAVARGGAGTLIASGLGQNDYAKIARAMGCAAARIESIADLIAALGRLKEATEPIVLDVVTTEDAPFWQVQSPFAKEGAGGE